MKPGQPNRYLLPVLLAAAVLFPSAASGGCSRQIVVPAAPTGQSVTVHGSEVGGVFPSMLNNIGAKAGCSFHFSIVPRIRLEAMFQAGSADLLIAATQVERRDRHGTFVPVFEVRPTLISIASERPPVRSIAELLTRRELRVALVRGFDYGAPYQAMIEQLTAQGRLYMGPDARAVARLIAGAMADVTIMPASAFIGGLQGDARIEGLAGKLRIEALDELTWIKTGIYLSNRSLSAADRTLLEQALSASVKSGAWWQELKRYYPPAVLNDNARPHLPRR